MLGSRDTHTRTPTHTHTRGCDGELHGCVGVSTEKAPIPSGSCWRHAVPGGSQLGAQLLCDWMAPARGVGG